jgi:CubicO group peptidase (beta-lactamase class C family)
MDVQVSSPAASGVSADGILAFIDAIEADPNIEPHGLIIQRHGQRIAEGYWAPHTADRNRLVYSLSKTFTGTALGLQIGEGRLGLDDLVSQHLPELFGPADDRTKRMRIRHLASMSTGHNREMLMEAILFNRQDPVKGFLAIAPDQEPGTVFAYSQPPVLALATIMQRLAGERLVDYLKPRVLDPIGIADLRWSQHRPGIDLGFSGVHTNLDAIARLGQLYLNEGMCNGKRLLPPGWVADASSVQTPNPEREEPDWRQGYGFQLWMSQHGYRGDGAFGQYMVVLPEHDAVVAMFSCTNDMQRVLGLMWEHLLPAMDVTGSGSDASDDLLAVRLAALTLATASERLGGTPVNLMSNEHLLPGHPTLNSQRTITAIETRGDRIVLQEGESDVRGLTVALSTDWVIVDDSPFASSATTLPDGRVIVDIVFLETPHRLELTVNLAAKTFTTKWPIEPLSLTGEQTLASMRAPN